MRAAAAGRISLGLSSGIAMRPSRLCAGSLCGPRQRWAAPDAQSLWQVAVEWITRRHGLHEFGGIGAEAPALGPQRGLRSRRSFIARGVHLDRRLAKFSTQVFLPRKDWPTNSAHERKEPSPERCGLVGNPTKAGGLVLKREMGGGDVACPCRHHACCCDRIRHPERSGFKY